jgi:hypothetical protein
MSAKSRGTVKTAMTDHLLGHHGPAHGLGTVLPRTLSDGLAVGVDLHVDSMLELGLLSRQLDCEQRKDERVGSVPRQMMERKEGARTFPSLKLEHELEVGLDENVQSSSSYD